MYRCSAPFIAALSLASLLLAPLAQAADGAVESLRTFLEGQARAQAQGAEVSVEIFDSGARFPACAKPQPFLPDPNQQLLGRVSVGLRCGDDPRSVRYLSAHVSVMGDYVTLAAPVLPGTPLDASVLATRRGDLSKLPPQTLRRPEEALGLVTRQRLEAGSILQRQHLRAEPLVEPGREVTIEAKGRGFAIRQTGRALERGALGDSIRVRLPQGRSVIAVVSGRDLVTVSP